MGRIIRRSSPQRSNSSPQRSSAPQRSSQAQQARQATGAKPAAQAARPASTQAAKPATANSQAPPTKDQASVNKPDAKGSTAESKSVFDRLKGGLDSAYKEMTGQNKVKLTDAEREQVMKASGVLDRLAGKDGMWNNGDLQNNVRQLEKSGDLSRAVNEEIGRRVAERKSGKGPLGRGLINMHMNRNYGNYHAQGMQQARGMAHDQLQAGLDSGGVKRSAGHDAARAEKAGEKTDGLAGKPISRGEMEQFSKAMEMLKARSKAQGLPEVKFTNGIPAEFLRAIGQNRSASWAVLDSGADIGK